MKRFVIISFYLCIGILLHAQVNLDAYEYWFNNDYNNVQVVAISPITHDQISTDIDISTLNDGVNILNLRYKDDNGFYSSTLSKVFYKNTELLTSDKELISYQYWFNNNYSNVQEISISPTTNQELTTAFDVSILADGINVLNIRFKDENNTYSSTLSKVFYKNTEVLITNKKLVGYEYWFNDDFSNVQQTSIAPTKNDVLISNIDVTELYDGINVLNIRYLDESGIYSVTLNKVFYKNTEVFTLNKKLVGYEYWFNNDFSNVQQTSIAPTENDVLISNIDVTELYDGINVLNIRYLDESGIYSVTLSKVFYKNTETYNLNNKLASYEFWFNNDYSNVQLIDITPTTQQNLITAIDATGLPDGINVLNIREKDENGIYSSTLSKLFYKTQGILTANKIFEYRYWIDNDFANAVNIILNQPAEQLLREEYIDLTNITKGEHTIHFQYRDSINLWSVVNTDTIEKLSYPIANFEFTNLADCDSAVIYFTDLSVDGDDYLWDFGNGDTDTIAEPIYTYYEAGDYTISLTVTDTLTFADSTVYRNLSLSGNTFAELNDTECDSYISPSGNYTYTSSGVYSDTIPNFWGCDSIISINLNINNSTTSTDIITSCFSYTWIDDITYTSSNNLATFVTTNSVGCDSIISLNLTINTVDTAVIVSGITLTSEAVFATYRWLDCDNDYAPIPNETDQSYTATTNGHYAVEVTQNGCTDTSYCYEINTVNINDYANNSSFAIYPNPTTGKIYLESSSNSKINEVYIYNLQGKLIQKNTFGESSLIEIDINFPAGMYYVSIHSNEKTAVFKLVKNR